MCCVGPLAVRPGLQGQGLGSALLDYAETLYAETRADVSNFRPNMIQFYQKRGYRSDRVNFVNTYYVDTSSSYT